MDWDVIAWLILAGFVSGVMNSLAGGGSLVTFPALVAAGIAPVSASATNSFSVTPGYIVGCIALRKAVSAEARGLILLVPAALLGGWLGSGILLSVGDETFSAIVPWLMVGALVIFGYGSYGRSGITRVLHRWLHWPQGLIAVFSKRYWFGSLQLLLATPLVVLVGSYGGFFNAGMGIMVLACLGISGMTSIHSMNGIKLLISSLVSVAALARFAAEEVIDWEVGGIVMIGTVIGGYSAAYFSRLVPEYVLRAGVLVIGSVVVGVFFARS